MDKWNIRVALTLVIASVPVLFFFAWVFKLVPLAFIAVFDLLTLITFRRALWRLWNEP